MPSSCAVPLQDDAVRPAHRWLAVCVLAVATFTIVVMEFAPIGLLTSVAADLGETPASVGLIVSAYAWIGAGSALLSAVLPNHFPRKPLLVCLMLLLAASGCASALAPSFQALMLARIFGALAHGVFWAMVAALSAQIAPAGRMGLATSIVFGGISVGGVLGVPLTNLIGQTWNWRVAFGALGALSLLTAILMMTALPRIKAEGSVGRTALASVLRNRSLWLVYLVATFTVIAHFGAFTFIEPFFREMPGIAPTSIATLLFAFGAAGLVGNVLTGFVIDRFMRPAIAVALILMCVALIGLGSLSPRFGLPIALPLLLAWGAAISALFVGIQTWVLQTGGAAAIPASAVYTTIFNAASGIGAMLGALILSDSGLAGILLWAGVAAAVAALLVALSTTVRGTA